MKLKIGCEIFNIKIGGRQDFELAKINRYGQVDFHHSLIQIAENIYDGTDVKCPLQKSKILQTIIHEILHAIFEHYGIDNDEKIVKTISTDITKHLYDNKKVIMSLLEKYL